MRTNREKKVSSSRSSLVAAEVFLTHSLTQSYATKGQDSNILYRRRQLHCFVCSFAVANERFFV